jgi:hypothetical protein
MLSLIAFAQNSHNVFGGSGLGLFVSRKLCDLMDGGIDVDSVYGQGATFRFFIRALAVRPAPPRSHGPAPSRSGVLGTWSGDLLCVSCCLSSPWRRADA